MTCDNKDCLCPELCYINSGCILTHELLKNDRKARGKIATVSGKQRPAFIINLLQKKKKPKVRRNHFNRYFAIRKKFGFDPDRRKPIKK